MSLYLALDPHSFLFTRSLRLLAGVSLAGWSVRREERNGKGSDWDFTITPHKTHTHKLTHLFSFPCGARGPSSLASPSCSRRIISRNRRLKISSSCRSCPCRRRVRTGGGGEPSPPVQTKKPTATRRKRKAPICED